MVLEKSRYGAGASQSWLQGFSKPDEPSFLYESSGHQRQKKAKALGILGKHCNPKYVLGPSTASTPCIQAQTSLVTVIATGQPYDVGRTMRLPTRTRFHTETTDD
jgi:hypothetical protein